MIRDGQPEWKVIGLDEDEVNIEIASQEYIVDRQTAVIAHAILCLCDQVRNAVDAIDEMHSTLDSRLEKME